MLSSCCRIMVFQKLLLNWLLLLTLCPSSCLWNHHWFWQICPDSHPRQQAEVKTLYCWRIGCSFFVCAVWWTCHFCSTESCRRTWCVHTQQVENLSSPTSRFLNFIIISVSDKVLQAMLDMFLHYCCVCRCGKPIEPRADSHAARSEDQCPGQRAQWNISGNPTCHDSGFQW